MSEQHHTIFIVPGSRVGRRPWRFSISDTQVRNGIAAGVGVLLILVAGMVHYFTLIGRGTENTLLREENLRLSSELKVVREKVAHINDVLDRVKHLNANLQNITELHDPDRKLAMGPLEPPKGAESVGGARAPDAAASPAPARVEEKVDSERLVGNLDKLEGEAKKQESASRELTSYFEDQKQLLASAPSIWPARGWVTSDFAVRLDPYTAERVMHEGLDIAAGVGTPVYAPADGSVVFAGVEGGYGKVLVLDHGYGLKTRYGHLSEIDVKVGEKVHRGDLIAAIGNTGRSTGPHLHYEVRVNGLPENPRKFILEE